MHFIVEEIDEDTSMEELQKMMLVALVYRILVCFYEVRDHMHAAHPRLFYVELDDKVKIINGKLMQILCDIDMICMS